MKKRYIKPMLEIEYYELSSNIAINCWIVVNMGPEGPDAIEVCKEYYDKSGETAPEGITLYSTRPSNVQFWSEQTCDCYYTAGAGFFTS